MPLLPRRIAGFFFFADAAVGLRFGITFGFFIIPGMTSSLSDFTHRHPMRLCKCLASTHGLTHFCHVLGCMVDAMALQRGLLPRRKLLWFFHLSSPRLFTGAAPALAR